MKRTTYILAAVLVVGAVALALVRGQRAAASSESGAVPRAATSPSSLAAAATPGRGPNAAVPPADEVRPAPVPAVELGTAATGALNESPGGAAAGRNVGADGAAPAGAPGGPSAGVGQAAERDTAEPQGAQGSDAAAQGDPATILNEAARAYRGIRSMRAEFTQNLRNEILGRTYTSHGTLYQRQPDRLLMRFTQPEGTVYVSDGEYLWHYDPESDARQVIRMPARTGSGAVDLQGQFVGDPTERFQYELVGREPVGGRPADVLTLVPRDRAAGYRMLKVWLDTEDRLARRIEITELNGNVRRLDLSGLELNPTLPDSLFRFEPPPNARIVTP